jgi:adenosylcobyric acid synthase
MTAKVLMLQGASSSVGKSLLVAALCRIWARRGVRVAPFKAQNMSNNAAVCADGAEIGRAQAVQAFAAGIEPTADMNPLLLKPEADARSQVILLGRPWRTLSAGTFYRHKMELWPEITRALDRLRAEYELVVIEGAGSAAELNLKAGDLVNMAVARYAQSPVLLVGDIDRGGIFAQLLGTMWLLEPEEQALVNGFLVNKFRGDLELFADGVRILEARGGVPVLGVIPYIHGLGIPEEDAVAIESLKTPSPGLQASEEVDIVVIALPRISNFDDFDPLAAEPGVRVRYVSSVQDLGRPDAVILPGSKSTIADLTWLREQGLAKVVRQLANGGTPVVGICGGYQMLGQVIRDPDHTESPVDSLPGLGLLSVETTFEVEKATYRAQARLLGGPGWLTGLRDEMIKGYEIHVGRTSVGRPWLAITERSGRPVNVPDGAVSEDGRIWGCYLHGLFENDSLRRAWLSELGWREATAADRAQDLLVAVDRLADAVEAALDMTLLENIVDMESLQ